LLYYIFIFERKNKIKGSEMMESNFRDDELVKVQGKQYPLVGGRLRLAHEENKELSIVTNIINLSDDKVVVQANIKTQKGNFSGLGNASSKRDRLLSNALVELAETRAIARGLRFAGYGVEFTGFEEVHDNTKELAESFETNQGDNTPATKSQLESVAALAKKNNISSKQLHSMMLEITGKSSSKELTSNDISKLMASLRKIEKEGTTRIS